MSEPKKVPIGEQCKQALEHYLKISDGACHYNSLIPKAIEFYRKMHVGYHDVELFYREECKHKELEEIQEMKNGSWLFQCKECPHLFMVDSIGEGPREPTAEDFQGLATTMRDEL